MKKLLIIITCLCLLTSCKTNDNNSELIYNSYINKLQNINEEKVNKDLSINFIVEEFDEDFLNYTVLIDKNTLVMNEVEALLVHDKQSINSFPSIGIFDDKINLNESSKKGIKLSGYVEKTSNITLKLLIKYKNKEGIEEEYYYIYKYHQI